MTVATAAPPVSGSGDNGTIFTGCVLSGLSNRYDLGSERYKVGWLIGERPVRDGGAGTTLCQLMQDGDGVLLDASGDGRGSRLVAGGARRIRCAAVDAGPSLLIRPDAGVAWAGDVSDTAGLEQAPRRWF